MFTYLKYLEDNLNNKYLKEFEEYRKYLKIYYSENSKCPVDSKTLLLKKETTTEYEMWCKSKTSKDWKIIIKKPKVYNLNIKLNELNIIYKNKLLLFKQKLRENLESPVYIPEKDKEMESELKELKNTRMKLNLLKNYLKSKKKIKRTLFKKAGPIENSSKLKLRRRIYFDYVSRLMAIFVSSLLKLRKMRKKLIKRGLSKLQKLHKLHSQM